MVLEPVAKVPQYMVPSRDWSVRMSSGEARAVLPVRSRRERESLNMLTFMFTKSLWGGGFFFFLSSRVKVVTT